MPTRNSHWKEFVTFIASNICKYHTVGALDPECLVDFALHHREFARLRDYISTIKNRLIALRLLSAGQGEVLLLNSIQKRITLFSKREEPSKAPPASLRHISKLSLRQTLQFKVCVSTAVRTSSAQTLNLNGKLPGIGGKKKFLLTSSDKSKTDSFKIWVPMSLAVEIQKYEQVNPWSRVFPMSLADMACLCYSMGLGARTHGFRRAFAVIVRIKADKLGLRTKKAIKSSSVFLRINKLANWSGEQFFEYSKDFHLHVETPLWIAQEVMEYIFEDFVKDIKMIETPGGPAMETNGNKKRARYF